MDRCLFCGGIFWYVRIVFKNHTTNRFGVELPSTVKRGGVGELARKPFDSMSAGCECKCSPVWFTLSCIDLFYFMFYCLIYWILRHGANQHKSTCLIVIILQQLRKIHSSWWCWCQFCSEAIKTIMSMCETRWIQVQMLVMSSSSIIYKCCETSIVWDGWKGTLQKSKAIVLFCSNSL